jgi:hypothetical protein
MISTLGLEREDSRTSIKAAISLAAKTSNAAAYQKPQIAEGQQEVDSAVVISINSNVDVEHNNRPHEDCYEQGHDASGTVEPFKVIAQGGH